MKIADSTMEYGIYLFVFATFLSISLWQLALTVILLAWVAKHVATRGRHLDYLRHPLAVIGLVFGALVLISTFYAHDTLEGLRVYKNTIGAAMILLVAIPDSFRDERRLTRLLGVLAGTALAVVLVQVGRYAADYLEDGTFREYAHYRTLSEALVFYLPFALAIAVLSKKQWAIIFWIVVMALQIGLLLATGARGAWIAVMAALLIWMVLSPGKKSVMVAVALAVVALALVTLVPAAETFFSRRMAGGLIDTSAMERISRLWTQAYEMIAARPLLGYGYGDYFGELNRQSAQHPEWVVYRPGPYGPHNNFLDIWFSAGIVALACLIYLYARFFGQLVATIRSSVSPLSMYFALATLCAFTTHFLVRSFVDDMNWRPLGVLMGIAVALSAVRRTADPANSI